MCVAPRAGSFGGWNRSAVVQSCTTVTLLSKVTTATSTRREASASLARSCWNARSPSFRAAMAAPCIEPDVSSSRMQGHRGSWFSANSTASSSKHVSAIRFSPRAPAARPAARGAPPAPGMLLMLLIRSFARWNAGRMVAAEVIWRRCCLGWARRDRMRWRGTMSNEAVEFWEHYGPEYQRSCQIPVDVHYGPGSPNEAHLQLIGPVAGKRILEVGCGGAQCSV